MTDLEREALATLEEVVSHFAAGRHVTHTTYLSIMTHVRDTLRHLQNHAYGCSTGLHAGKCTCKPAILGKSST